MAQNQPISLTQGYEQLCNLIIRPPRFLYSRQDLGPTEFRIGNTVYSRNDIELLNPRGLTIQGSHYKPKQQNTTMPCVIYAHGNCGSRMDGLDCLRTLLPFCTVFTLDFSGCGLSEGQYISLGYFEKQDVASVVNYLRNLGNVGRIGIWGRSMGAATSIFYAQEDPSVTAIVLDSCYSSLKLVAEELVSKSQFKVPKFLLSLGLRIIRGSIKTRAKFDINELEPIKVVNKCYIPALFIHGNEDTFVLPHHTHSLHDKYAGDKNKIIVEGDHNTLRPSYVYDSISIFFQNLLIDQQTNNNDNCEINNNDNKNDVNIQKNNKKKSKEEDEYKYNSNRMLPYKLTDEYYENMIEEDEEEQMRNAIKESLNFNDRINHRQQMEDFFDENKELSQNFHRGSL